MVVCVDIDFDLFTELEVLDKLAQEVSKYPVVSLDYTIILNDIKYGDLESILKEFKSNLIKSYELLDVYQNKYTIRYILGNDNKTLDQKDIQSFKERFISHLNKNNLSIVVSGE